MAEEIPVCRASFSRDSSGLTCLVGRDALVVTCFVSRFSGCAYEHGAYGGCTFGC